MKKGTEKHTDVIRKTKWRRIKRDLVTNRYLYLLLLPVVANFIIFHYIPMGGIIIAFKRYNIARGFLESPWIGFQNFQSFFNSYYFTRLIRNTLSISLLSLIWGFPVPILFAILLNEIKVVWFKKMVQTVSYLPYFLSVIIVVGLLNSFLSMDGVVNSVIQVFGGEPISFLSKPEYFRTIYIASGIWQSTGFAAIIYIAAMSGIDPELYLAAAIDGAGRIRRIWHVTLPGLVPTIVILLIISMGSILNADWMKIMLMQTGLTKEVSDVIQLFVYQRGLINADYSFATAVGLFQSVIGFILIVVANKISKSVSEIYIF